MNQPVTTPRATLWAAFMFYLSLGFLALAATITVLWIDVPRVAEEGGDEVATSVAVETISPQDLQFEQAAFDWGVRCGIGLLLLWPVFLAEQLVKFFRSESMRAYRHANPRGWLICIFPPLRMCERERGSNDEKRLWLPWRGWQVIDRQLRRELAHKFSVPMILIALLILPVLGLQFYFKDRIYEYPILRFSLHVGTGLIWFAFTVEFIVMVSVADKKLRYCKEHWLDLLIILLPLVSFLRTLRLIRMTKLVKVGKLHQLTRVVRVYRLRGVAMRTMRALMLLDVLNRILPSDPERRLLRLEDDYSEKKLELAELKQEIDQLRAAILLADNPIDGDTKHKLAIHKQAIEDARPPVE